MRSKQHVCVPIYDGWVRKRLGDKPLWALFVLFLGWEFGAHFQGARWHEHTLSNRIWELEDRHPWTRTLVGAFCGGLSAHLLWVSKRSLERDP
jgi:hypothetical protein